MAFCKDGRELKVRVEGPLVFNTITLMIDMALAGLGLAYVPEDQVRNYLEKGRLVQVLRLVSPFLRLSSLLSSRRQPTPAFALLVDALRFGRWGDPERPRATDESAETDQP